MVLEKTIFFFFFFGVGDPFNVDTQGLGRVGSIQALSRQSW